MTQIFNDMILPRLENFGMGILESGVTIGFTALGIGATILSLTPLDKVDRIRNSKKFTWYSAYIVPLLYRGVMKAIDPNVDLPNMDPDSLKKYAFLTRNLATPFYDKAIEFAGKDGFWEKHVFSRAAFVGGALVSTITRTIEFVAGYFVAIASFATAGQVDKINKVAFGLLASTSLIHDICVSLRGLVNPQQFVPAPVPAPAPTVQPATP